MVQHTQLVAFQKRGKKGVEKGEEGRKSWRALTHGPLAPPPTTLMPHRSPGDLSKRLDQQLLQRTSRGHETAQNLLRHHATKPNRNLELDSQRQRAHQKQVTQAGCCINPSIRQPVGPPVQIFGGSASMHHHVARRPRLPCFSQGSACGLFSMQGTATATWASCL